MNDDVRKNLWVGCDRYAGGPDLTAYQHSVYAGALLTGWVTTACGASGAPGAWERSRFRRRPKCPKCVAILSKAAAGVEARGQARSRTNDLIDGVTQRALERMTDDLDDLVRERGVTREEVRARLDEAWGTVEAWDDWCEENP